MQKRNRQRICVGIAEGGARTRDLEVMVIVIDKSHTLYRLSYPGRSDDLVHCVNWLLTDGSWFRLVGICTLNTSWLTLLL